MPTRVVYAVSSRAILIINPQRDKDGNAILPTDVQSASADISDSESAKFSQPSGGFVLGGDGQTITILPVPAANPVEVELSTARSDLKTQYQQAITRLDQIIGASNPTNAQVVAAIQDLATIQKRTLRLINALLT